ncbi:hypothetical protein [Lactiplantibacillus pentosus]|nr:hypothetical protein [Lactiplantibacillus pentosus]WKF76340.1 hypothetical protein QYC20_02080 [Lactiplantibacillus pentosus]
MIKIIRCLSGFIVFIGDEAVFEWPAQFNWKKVAFLGKVDFV